MKNADSWLKPQHKKKNLYVCARRIFQEHIVQLDVHYTKQVCESLGCVKSLFQMKGWEPEWSVPQLIEMPKNEEKKMVYPLLPKCSNFQITEFSPALETDFESIFVSGGYNQGGRGLDHFASEPFKYVNDTGSNIHARWGLGMILEKNTDPSISYKQIRTVIPTFMGETEIGGKRLHQSVCGNFAKFIK